MLKDFRPDALIINLALPYMDGLSVLQRTDYLPPTVLALTGLATPFILQSAKDAGVGQVVLIPATARLVVSQLNQMLSLTPGLADDQALVRGYLKELGFPDNRIAYKELYVGIPVFAQDTSQSLLKEVYPVVIACCGKKTEGSAEIAIRDLIAEVWEKCDPVIWEKYFPGATKAPSNRAFFKALAEKLNREKQ